MTSAIMPAAGRGLAGRRGPNATAAHVRTALVVMGIAVVAMAAPPGMGTVAAGAATPPAGADDQPLQAAGKAAEQVSFVGVLEVRWSEGATNHRETLLVQGGNGSVVVRGGTNVMASAKQRLVEHAAGRWDLLSPVGASGAGRPAPALKYHLASSDGPLVTNRPTHVIEVHHAGDLLERLYLDEQTGLLLRREQFGDQSADGAGPDRTIEFETVAIGGSTPVPSPPASVVDAAPRVVSARHVPDGVSAPAALADGYQRVGLYRRDGVVQVLYSDGLYDLSVFQQPGRIDHHGLPAGNRVAVGRDWGSEFGWAGGHIVLWEDSGTVYTAVSDAPLDQVLTAAGSLPPAHGSSPLLRRLRQACRALVQPFAA